MVDMTSYKGQIDLVFCVDGTKSMAPYLDGLKDLIINFPERLHEAFELAGKDIGNLRVKTLAFRDFASHGDRAIEESVFYNFSASAEETQAFRSFVNGIEIIGEDGQEANAFEALALALKSDWTAQEGKKRHVVLMFSQAPVIPLGERKACPNYPKGMPKDLAELGAWWQGTDEKFIGSYQARAGRLIVFAPMVEPWTDLWSWNRTWQMPSMVGEEEFDQEIDIILDMIVGAI